MEEDVARQCGVPMLPAAFDVASDGEAGAPIDSYNSFTLLLQCVIIRIPRGSCYNANSGVPFLESMTPRWTSDGTEEPKTECAH